jgi:hypothetical protein
MKVSLASCASVLIAVLAIKTCDALAVDNFQRLKGQQIHAKFAGMEMTDEVHWSDVYERNGTLTTYEMGDKRLGKWWVQKDELCHDRGNGLKACYEVWISGKKVELRGGGSTTPLEGVLGTPAQHE